MFRSDHADPDDVVVERVRAGDAEAFSALFVRYHAILRDFAATYLSSVDLADDIVQDVFVDLWLRRGGWAPASSIRAYLFRAVRNRAIDRIRHQHTAASLEAMADGEFPIALGESPLAPDVRVDLAELTSALRVAIEALPSRRRRVAILRWRYDLSYAEIGEALGMSVAAATMHVMRAREALHPVIQLYTDKRDC